MVCSFSIDVGCSSTLHCSAFSLQKYYELYAEDKKRYDRAMEEYTKKQKLTALVAETGVDGNTCQDNSNKPSS